MSQSPELPSAKSDAPSSEGKPALASQVNLNSYRRFRRELARLRTRVRSQRPSPRVYLGVGAGLLCGLIGAIGLGQVWADRLVTKAQRRVNAVVTRPIQWGDLEGISWRGLRLGRTDLLPTVADPSYGHVEAVEVGLDWPSLVRQRRLRANLTLVQPELTLVQTADGQWPTIPLERNATSTPNGSSLDQLASLRIDDGSLTVTTLRAPQSMVVPRQALQVQDLNATVELEQAVVPHQVDFSASGKVGQGGFHLQGTGDLFSRSIEMQGQTYYLPLTGINLLLPPRAGIGSGQLNSNLSLAAALDGEGGLDYEAVDVRGTAILQAGQLQLGHLAQPVSDLHSTLWFQGQQITLHNTGLRMGNLAFSTGGQVDLQQGYNLMAQVPAVTAADIQAVVGEGLPLDPSQTLQLTAKISGPIQKPNVQTDPPIDARDYPGLHPTTVGALLGMAMVDLPLRDKIPLIEGASYAFRGSGAWFTLSDGTVVPPISQGAYWRGSRRLGSAISPSLDRKFFWFLQTNPYVTAIAADLSKGKLGGYKFGRRFSTDQFFVDYFIPVYVESSRAAGMDPGEPLWMLNHALRTLQDPIMRGRNAIPITSGYGAVGSFWEDEQVLSMQQLLLRPHLAQAGPLRDLLMYAALKHTSEGRSIYNRRLSSAVEVITKIPKVTFGAEEGAIAMSLVILEFEGADIYSDRVRALANTIVQNERDKQAQRTVITGHMQTLANDQTNELGDALVNFSDQDWQAVGLGPTFSPTSAGFLNGTNTLSVLVSRNEKAGYPLEQSYQNSRALLIELLQHRNQLEVPEKLVFAVLKDQAFRAKFWEVMAQKLPQLRPQLETIASEVEVYRDLANQGASYHEALYAAMVEDDEDIGVSAAIKQAVGFQAHLAELMDQAFAPANPNDPRYQKFRRSLGIYLREVPDISLYGGSEASLRLYGQEMLNLQELIAVDVAAAPRIRAFAALYQEARAQQMIGEWDVAGFQSILLTGAFLAAGVERHQLPASIRNVGFPSAEFRRNLLLAVGPEGATLEATRMGIQAHDNRVSFQPVAMPAYRAPSFDVNDPAACPTQPAFQAIALGPDSEFVWNAEIEKVVLRRGETGCLLGEDWTEIFFDTLLTSVPIIHSEAGSQELQRYLRAAQLLEAGIFY
jgi:hypothetical protein